MVTLEKQQQQNRLCVNQSTLFLVNPHDCFQYIDIIKL